MGAFLALNGSRCRCCSGRVHSERAQWHTLPVPEQVPLEDEMDGQQFEETI